MTTQDFRGDWNSHRVPVVVLVLGLLVVAVMLAPQFIAYTASGRRECYKRSLCDATGYCVYEFAYECAKYVRYREAMMFLPYVILIVALVGAVKWARADYIQTTNPTTTVQIRMPAPEDPHTQKTRPDDDESDPSAQ